MFVLMVLVVGVGFVFCDYVNDVGFWMIKEYFGFFLKEIFFFWLILIFVLFLVGLVMVYGMLFFLV